MGAGAQGTQACSGIVDKLATGSGIATEQRGYLADRLAQHVAKQEGHPRQQGKLLKRGLEFDPYAVATLDTGRSGMALLRGFWGVHVIQTR